MSVNIARSNQLAGTVFNKMQVSACFFMHVVLDSLYKDAGGFWVKLVLDMPVTKGTPEKKFMQESLDTSY